MVPSCRRRSSTCSDRVNDYWDRGLLGIAVDPDLRLEPLRVPPLHVRERPERLRGPEDLATRRVTVTGDTASPSSEVVVLGTVSGPVKRSCNDLPDRERLPAVRRSRRTRSATSSSRPTRPSSSPSGTGRRSTSWIPTRLRARIARCRSRGKVLRVTRTGQGLATNPFWTGNANDNRSKVWAFGVRNAYRFNLRPGRTCPTSGDVGGPPGGDQRRPWRARTLGWPCYEGSLEQSRLSCHSGRVRPCTATPAGGRHLACPGRIHRGGVRAPGERRSEPRRDPGRGQTARREHRLEPSVRQLGRGQLRERGLGRL